MRRIVPVSVLVAAVFSVATSAVPPTAQAAAPARQVQSNPDSGNFSLRLLEVPTDLAEDPRAQTYIIDQLKPGTTIQRRVEVTNHLATVLHVALYPDAADITDGAFIGAAGHTVNELASWTTLSQDSLDVPPGASVRDCVTIAVPRDAAPGERYAVLWAAAAGETGGGVNVVNRVGVRVYLSIGGDNPPASKFTVNTLTAERDTSGRAIVQALVHNTGGRALDMSGTLTMSAASGTLKAGPYRATLGTTLAPGQSEPVKVMLTDAVTDGPWDATIELKSGLLDETYQARITFPHDPGDAAPAAAHPKTGSGHLALITVVLLTLGLLAVAAVLVARRRTPRRRRT